MVGMKWTLLLMRTLKHRLDHVIEYVADTIPGIAEWTLGFLYEFVQRTCYRES